MTSGPDRERSLTKEQAQKRADQVFAFKQELAELERDGVLTLSGDERSRLDGYHGQLLEQLARQFDVDRSAGQRQMSLGMRVVSFLGAVTLSAAVALFFYRFWGLLSTPAQVAVLVAAPLLALVGVDVAARATT